MFNFGIVNRLGFIVLIVVGPALSQVDTFARFFLYVAFGVGCVLFLFGDDSSKKIELKIEGNENEKTRKG